MLVRGAFPKAICQQLFGQARLAAYVLCLFSLVTVFNEWHQYLELFSHFRSQYFLIAIGLGIVFVLGKSFRFALGMLIVALLNAVYVLPWYFSATEVTQKPGADLRVLLSNVEMINENYPALIALIKNEQPDIFIAQEVNTRWLSELAVFNTEYPHQLLKPLETNFGIALFSKVPLLKSEIVRWGTANIPSLQVRFEFQERQVTLLSSHPFPPLYASSYQARNAQLIEMGEVAKHAEQPVIVVGDLNVTMWSHAYTAMVHHAGLRNVREGFGVLPSWPSDLPAVMRIPIDHCLISEDISVSDVRLAASIGSDHLPLIVDLVLH